MGSSRSADFKNIGVIMLTLSLHHRVCIFVKFVFKNTYSQSQHCIQSCTQFHWFPGFFLKQNIDLLARMTGSWPVDMDYFRRLRGLFAASFC